MATKIEVIEQEIADHGLEDAVGKAGRGVLNSVALQESISPEAEVPNIEGRDFSRILTFLEGEKRVSDEETVKRYGETQDDIERLELLRNMSARDAIDCIRTYSEAQGGYRYLANRLSFYQKLIRGEATYTGSEDEWNEQTREYVKAVKEYTIDASNTTPETIRLGLLRDTMYAAMIGTPEMGIFKITDKRLEQKGVSRLHMPELKGYHSYIHEGSIGYAYPFLRKLYDQARDYVEERLEAELDVETIEHRAVITAANWLEEAMNYNSTGRGPESPYISSKEEAVAWARLGDQVKRQLRGMRQKISGIDLKHIDRFIGKSGDDKYDPERKRLYGQIKFLRENADDGAKQEFTARENHFAVEKQQRWYECEMERLNHRFEKSKTELEQFELPEEEKQLQLQRLNASHDTVMANLHEDYESTVARLQSRTPEQLIEELEQRQELVNERHEKRKSLAQKALDLHFTFNHHPDNDKPYADLIDWINYAPLGTIKRAHKMLRLGIKDEAIIEYALADIIAGARGATREDLKEVHELVKKTLGDDWNARNKLQSMMKVGNILSLFNYEVPLDEVADLASKNFYGMTEALRMYDLEQVKLFMDQGVSLQSITEAKKITEKFGHNLESDAIAEIASRNIKGLEDAFNSFDFDSVKFLLSQDVYLPTAVAVQQNTREFGYHLDITEIGNIAKSVQDIEDFEAALRSLPLEEVQKLFTAGIAYHDFSSVRGALEKHGYNSGFSSSLELAIKLNEQYSSLDGALEVYSLKEVGEMIKADASINSAIAVREALINKEVSADLAETIQFTKYAGSNSQGQYVEKAIDTFGLENTRKIIAGRCYLDKAIEVQNFVNGSGTDHESIREILNRGGIDAIIAIAKTGNIEVAVQTLEAGFTIEEVIKFPFLISPLIANRQGVVFS